jgi:hypothetical protein
VERDSTVEMFNRRLITVEAGLPMEFGGEWHFDDRNRISRGNKTIIHLNRGAPNMWRWRSDASVDIGCSGNRFDCDTILVTGSSSGNESNLLFSSSADCGQRDYLGQCVGAWNCTMDSCLINASAVTANDVHLNWQGGMRGWSITNCVFATNGFAILALDIHQSRVSNCTLVGAPAAGWKDSYGRTIWKAGDMTFTNNIAYSWGNGCIIFDPTMIVSGAYTVSKNLYWGCGSVPSWPTDGTSIYADPKFVNGSPGLAFDPHLLTGSPALPLGAGAYNGTPTGDTVASRADRRPQVSSKAPATLPTANRPRASPRPARHPGSVPSATTRPADHRPAARCRPTRTSHLVGAALRSSIAA